MTNVKIVPTDAVASPVVVDLTGPEADAPAILRFLASPSFNDALVKVAQAATAAERKRIADLCTAHYEVTMEDMVNGMFESKTLRTPESIRHHEGRMFALERLRKTLVEVST